MNILFNTLAKENKIKMASSNQKISPEEHEQLVHYQQFKLLELKEIAKRNNIKKFSLLKKRDLYELLKSQNLLVKSTEKDTENVKNTTEKPKAQKTIFGVCEYYKTVIPEETLSKLSDDVSSKFSVISEDLVLNREVVYGDYDEVGYGFEDLEIDEQWKIVEAYSDMRKTKIFFGDTVQFSQYRANQKYFVTMDKTFVCNPDVFENGSNTIPYEITRHLRNAMKIYNKKYEYADCIYLHCQDEFIKKVIVGNIPESWNWLLSYESNDNMICVELEESKKNIRVPFGTTVEAVLHYFETREKEHDAFEFVFKLQNYLFKFENQFLQNLPEKHRSILTNKLATKKLETIVLPLTWTYSLNKNVFFGPSDEFEVFYSFLKSSIIEEEAVYLLPDNSYFTTDPFLQNGRIYKNDNNVKKELLGIICDKQPIFMDLFEIKR